MQRRIFILGAAAMTVLSGCASKFRRYSGPEVTGIVINKGAREMFLLHEGKVLEQYEIDLGRAPAGPKEFEGDGKTPEGVYLIDRRNPNSSFHLSLGISYPNATDRAHAASMGKRPGGDIFIHGQPNRLRRRGQMDDADWTEGCIAVPNRAMEQIYAMVKNGTPIVINP
ncbi:hypothetical protein E4Z66_16985 [Aliishimia ponticola]|uniref:L,D-TPase catalytic domain-containing protein n=1 Tax=Aliishimia ponticola TaxID=2499833 RepID=A0A4S4N8J6_9RHOB|nr:L,D-transpeptidase family protein [Aliishimia ponticola]THH34667.1 hypothetical protein E4Z66_16985 [Aliishimia ponticola]